MTGIIRETVDNILVEVLKEISGNRVLVSSARQYAGAFFRRFSESLTKLDIRVLFHPPYSHDLAPADVFVSQIKNYVERDETRGSFIDLMDCDERTEGSTGISVF
jgi:hypothetical protein